MDDLISRQEAIDVLKKNRHPVFHDSADFEGTLFDITNLPSAQSTLCGYNVEHLKLIASVLQKENLPPERVAEVLTDIGRIVAMVADEFEQALRKAVDNVQVDLPRGCD